MFFTRRRHAQRTAGVQTRASSDIIRDGVDDPRMSQIVIHNNVVYLSGQVGASSNTVREQAIETLDKCEALLKRAGTTKDRMLTCMVWLKDIKDAPEFNAVYNEWIDGGNKPTRACVQAEMARPNLLVEVQVTAAMP
jgi:enamine deaminase RidA (YjgF/YER057c/UK114 family)